MPSVEIRLEISSEEFVRWYDGSAHTVVAMTTTGKTVEFAARHLQRFVTKEGVHGVFRLRFDDCQRFVEIERLDEGTKRQPGFYA